MACYYIQHLSWSPYFKLLQSVATTTISKVPFLDAYQVENRVSGGHISVLKSAWTGLVKVLRERRWQWILCGLKVKMYFRNIKTLTLTDNLARCQPSSSLCVIAFCTLPSQPHNIQDEPERQDWSLHYAVSHVNRDLGKSQK